jgi:hypothetical protein
VLPHPPDPTASLVERRAAIAAALRAVRADPPPVPATPDELHLLRAEVRRLSERVERVEDKVDLIRDGDDAPLAWPVSVTSDSRLEVPPLTVSRANSPAFDVLLGPSRRDSA